MTKDASNQRSRGNAIFDPKSKIQVLDVREIHHHTHISLFLFLTPSLRLPPQLRTRVAISPLGVTSLVRSKGGITRADVYYVCPRLRTYVVSRKLPLASGRTKQRYQIKSGTYNACVLSRSFFLLSVLIRVLKLE